MLQIQRKSPGPSATELLEATRKSYVKTEVLKNAKIDPGRPRMFSHDSDEEGKDKSSVNSQVRFRRRIAVQPSKSPDLICFCVTSTPKIRASNYNPLENPQGAFERVQKPPTGLSRAKSTPARPRPTLPPPRPPKPLWLRNSLLKNCDDSDEDVLPLALRRPLPAPRLSRQCVERRQSVPLRGNECEIGEERLTGPLDQQCRVDAVINENADEDYATAKTNHSSTTTPSTSRGTMSPRSARTAYSSSRNDTLFYDQLNSPDSDSGLHNSSFESLDNPFYNLKRVSLGLNKTGSRIDDIGVRDSMSETQAHASKSPLVDHSVDDQLDPVYVSKAENDQIDSPLAACQMGSELSVFTSVTEARCASSMASLGGGKSGGTDRTDVRSPIGVQPSVIEKNARVIKWIYNCAATAVA